MTLGSIVSRFGAFIGEQPVAPEPTAGERFPAELVRIRDTVGHHMVPLALLARSDGDNAPSEREVILRYCIRKLRRAHMELSLAEQASLSDFLRDFRPSRVNLRPALKRLEEESHEDIVALVEAAKAIVDADGERRPREVRFLSDLMSDLVDL